MFVYSLVYVKCIRLASFYRCQSSVAAWEHSRACACALKLGGVFVQEGSSTPRKCSRLPHQRWTNERCLNKRILLARGVHCDSWKVYVLFLGACKSCPSYSSLEFLSLLCFNMVLISRYFYYIFLTSFKLNVGFLGREGPFRQNHRPVVHIAPRSLQSVSFQASWISV